MSDKEPTTPDAAGSAAQPEQPAQPESIGPAEQAVQAPAPAEAAGVTDSSLPSTPEAPSGNVSAASAPQGQPQQPEGMGQAHAAAAAAQPASQHPAAGDQAQAYDAQAYGAQAAGAAQYQPHGSYSQHYTAAAVASQQAKPRGWFGRAFGAGTGFSLGAGLAILILQIPLFFGTLVMLAALADMGESQEKADTKVVYGEASAKKVVKVVPIEGVIMGKANGSDPFSVATYGYNVAAKIDELTKENSDALLLEMNTPGGTIFGSEAIADAVVRYKERTGNRVTAYVRGVSASGGMLAMAPADEIIVDHGTFVGSIGVIFGPFSSYENVTKENGLFGSGVEAGKITKEFISAGKGKDFGNSFRPMTDEERTHYTKQIDEEYNNFVKHVAEHRNLSEAKVKDEIGAYLYSPQEAINVGLADKVMGEHEAYKHVASAGGLTADETKFEMVTGEQTWWESLLNAKVPGVQNTQPLWSKGVAPATPQSTSRASICTQSATALVLHGDLRATCGG